MISPLRTTNENTVFVDGTSNAQRETMQTFSNIMSEAQKSKFLFKLTKIDSVIYKRPASYPPARLYSKIS